MNIEEALQNAGRDLITAFRQRLEQPIPKAAPAGGYNSPTTASGDLSKSLRLDTQSSPHEVSLEIYAVPHWRFADRGRPGGGFPPIERLVEWSLDKGLEFEDMQARRSFAFVLGRRIAQKGTLPDHSKFFQNTLPPWAENLPERLAPALRDWVDGEVKAVFKEVRQDPNK